MLLLDTQIVLWLALEPERVPETFLAAMIKAQNAGGLAISGTTLWEIAWLSRNNRIALTIPLSVFLDRLEAAYNVLPMTAHVALQGTLFSPKFPKDPADRQIAATAIIHGATLLTADRKIRQSGDVHCHPMK